MRAALCFCWLWVGTVAVVAEPSNPVEALVEDAIGQAERELGRRLKFAAVKDECRTDDGGSICFYRAGGSYFSAGIQSRTDARLFRLIRVRGFDDEFSDAAVVMGAFIEPAVPAATRRSILNNLITGIDNGPVARVIGQSVIAAGYTKQQQPALTALGKSD
ncbi:hypothetical protein ABE438_14645 [Bosea sp. TWI1241]|uniref:hypothetical protein n=1 Tax=Bosea sp. TWI1241 TaxID=3148904 RepID=UPI003208BC97